MPTPDQIQRAQTALRNPNLPTPVRQRLERIIKFAPAPEQPQPAPQAQPPQVTPPPQPAQQQPYGPPPAQQPVVSSPQDMTAMQDAQTQSPAEDVEEGYAPQIPNPEDIRFDAALYNLRQSWDAAEAEDIDPVNIDDTSTLTRYKQRVNRRESASGIDSSLKSMTQRPALYRDPVAGQRPVEDPQSNTLMYYEPLVEEVEAAHQYALQQAKDAQDDTGIAREELALERLYEQGRESDAYKKYADLKWIYVSHAANTAHSPQRVIRAAFAPEGEGDAAGENVMAPMGVGALEGLTLGLSTDAMAALEDRSKSPVAQRLKELGLGLGPNWAQSARDTGSVAEYWGGNALGLVAPWGPANLVLKGVGKTVQALGSAGARVGVQALADFGIDAASSVFRQMMKASAAGSDQDVDFGQAALEGAAGAVGGALLGSLPAEGARAFRERTHASNPLIAAQVDAGNLKGHGTGRRGALDRTAEWAGENPIGAKFPEKASIQDDLIQRSISDAQPRGPSNPRGAGSVTGKAARYVAEQVQPGLNKATRERTKLIAFKWGRYAKSEAAQQKHPVQNAFTKLHTLWQDVAGSTDSVRKSAARTLTEVSDVRVVSEAEAEALRTRGKGGANEGLIVVPLEDDIVRFMEPEKLRRAKHAYQARMKTDADRRSTTPAGPFTPPVRPLDPSLNAGQMLGEGNSLDTIPVPGGPAAVSPSTVPAPPFQPPVKPLDPRLNASGQSYGPPSSSTTIPVPGGPSSPNRTLIPPAPGKGGPGTALALRPSTDITIPPPPLVPKELRATGLLEDSLPLKKEKPKAVRKYVVLRPKKMNAVEYTKALQGIDEQLFSARGEAGGSAALRDAAAALRQDAAQWQGLPELRAEQRRLLTEMEGAERFTGLKTEEMAGRSVDRADRGSVRDMSLNRLAQALENRAYGGTGAQDLGSEGLAEYLNNPRLTGLLKGLRAVAAWEAQQGNRMANTRMGMSGTGPFGVISDVGAYIGDKLYRPAGTLETIAKQGKLPQQMQILFTPEAREFLANVPEKTLGDLMQADHEKAVKEAEQ